MLRGFWEAYLRDAGLDKEEKYRGAVCFGTDAKAANAAVKRVLAGEARAAIYPSEGYKRSMSGNAAPGDRNIVLNWDGIPCAVIETIAVREVALNRLSDGDCALEGVCATVSDWREVQMPLIKAEVEELGGSFDEGILLTVEEFRRAYPQENQA